MDKQFTIKDLAEGRVAVKNDGTVEELQRVIREAFPSSRSLLGDGIFYRISDFDETNEWFSYENESLFATPVQSVKIFIQQLDEFEKSLKEAKEELKKENEWEEVVEHTIPGIIGLIDPLRAKKDNCLHKDTDLGYFAGLAMQGLMTKDYVKLDINQKGHQYTNLEMVTEMSVKIAQELINQLDKIRDENRD